MTTELAMPVDTEPGKEPRVDPVAPPPTSKRVREWLLNDLYAKQTNAETVSKDLWQAIDAAETAYGINKKAVDSQQAGLKAAAIDSDYNVETFELADQTDEMIALIVNLLKSGRLWKLGAKEGMSEKQAELTQKVQESMLADKDFDDTLRILAGRFIKHKVAGVKVVRTREISYVTEQHIIPREELSDGVLMMMGYSPEAIADGTAVGQALAAKGMTFVGKADADENGNWSTILATSCKEVPQDSVYIAPLDARKIAVSDRTRRIQDQHSIHEYTYKSLNDLRKGYFKNLDKLKEAGQKITNSHQQRPGGDTDRNSATQGTLDVPVYEICETWTEINWEEAVLDGKFTEEELRVFAEEEEFPVNECRYGSQKWCAHHHKGDVLLKIYPNYLLEKDEFPHEMDSYIFGDGRFDGQGLMERLSNAASNLSAALNMIAANTKKMLYGDLLVSDRCEISDDDIRNFRKGYGKVLRTQGQTEIGRDIQFLTYPDVSGPGFQLVQYLRDVMRSLGVPSILAGEGNAETATQDSINNQRGQTIVNEAFGRLISLLIRASRKHLGCMVSTFTTARYVEIVGEDGMTMTRRWTQPKEITDKLSIVPLVSFEDANRQRMAQFLISTMNVFAMILSPQEVKEMFWVVLRKGGISETDIETIQGALGSATNVYQEVEAMLQDPELETKIRMDDPHEVCIQFAQAAIQKELETAAAEGRPPKDMRILEDYIKTHEGMLKTQQLMAMQQQLLAGGPQDLQGKPTQGRPDGGPGSEQGAARQEGQAVGAGNKGMQSAAGLTGQAMVPGVPAGV